MAKVKTIGVINGCGDAPGPNAVIRGVARSAIRAHGMRVIGIRNGFQGLIWPEGAMELTEESVSGILLRGVVAEGVKLPATDPAGKAIPPAGPGGVANTIAFTLREMLRKEIRVTVLGHVQRGGAPRPFDRILATRMGAHATDLEARGEFNRMVCLRGTRVDSVPLEEALAVMKLVGRASEIVHAARPVGTTFGDSA